MDAKPKDRQSGGQERIAGASGPRGGVVTLLLMMSVCFGSAVPAMGGEEEDGWRLVFADEFDYEGLPDPEKWAYGEGFIRNQEEQYYTVGRQKNARVQDGRLVIEAHRERKNNAEYDPDSDDWRRNRQYAKYTSASLTTRGKHTWSSGRFEARLRIHSQSGSWPAFWVLGVERDEGRGWPFSGEIDIMEFYRGNFLANVAWLRGPDGGTHWETTRFPVERMVEKTGDPDWAEKFHVWRMDWTEDSIRLYVDDILLNEVDLDEATYHWEEDNFNPFRDQKHYIILNLAIGGTEGGDPSEAEFPIRYEVDYVRVYAR